MRDFRSICVSFRLGAFQKRLAIDANSRIFACFASVSGLQSSLEVWFSGGGVTQNA